jgi:hypothetical protein
VTADPTERELLNLLQKMSGGEAKKEEPEEDRQPLSRERRPKADPEDPETPGQDNAPSKSPRRSWLLFSGVGVALLLFTALTFTVGRWLGQNAGDEGSTRTSRRTFTEYLREENRISERESEEAAHRKEPKERDARTLIHDFIEAIFGE